MSNRLGRLTFIALDGETPPELNLDILPAADRVASVIEAAFRPFNSQSVEIDRYNAQICPITFNEDYHLIYVYGHAWLADDVPHTACRYGNGTLIEDASELLSRLLSGSDPTKTVLVLDCCHAASFDQYVGKYGLRLIVYASGEKENAIAFHGESASRLSLAFSNSLSRQPVQIDLINIVGQIAQQLNKDGIFLSQTVTYRTHGREVILLSGKGPTQPRRERTVQRVRNRLIGSGVIVALIFTGLAWYYWSHTLVEINLSGLESIASNIVLSASEEFPETNMRSVFAEYQIDGSWHRIIVPSSNILLRISADYRDGHERQIAFHLTLRRQFIPFGKYLSLELPAAAEILRHPGMAYIPVTSWFHGREQEPRWNKIPYWIDLRPPTVNEYLPVANEFIESDVLGPKGSLLINWRETSSAIDALELNQLQQLSSNLSDVFAIIESADSPIVAGGGNLALGMGDIPCDTCPAPMFRREAQLFCERQNKQLPTNFQWELAARGVDGRTYPWGNMFDESRANVPGLPDKGDESPSLQPVDAYGEERSPYGLIDTVGNAGDWVVNDHGSYERVYMGATYKFNQEDATTFRMLPITDTDSVLKEITVRCIAYAREN